MEPVEPWPATVPSRASEPGPLFGRRLTVLQAGVIVRLAREALEDVENSREADEG